MSNAASGKPSSERSIPRSLSVSILVVVVGNFVLAIAADLPSTSSVTGEVGAVIGRVVLFPLLIVGLMQIGPNFRNQASRMKVFFWSSLVVTLTLVARIVTGAPDDLESWLRSGLDETNSNLPQMLNPMVRADSVSVDGNTLIYHYTLVDVLKSDVDAEIVALTFRESAMAACTDRRDVLKRGVTFAYEINDKEGEVIATARVDETVCSAVADSTNVDQSAVDARTVATRLPESINGLDRGELTDNEQDARGMGVTVPFSGSGAKATIYIYTDNVPKITDGPMSEVVQKEFFESVEELRVFAESMAQEPVLREQYGTGNPDTGPEFLCAEFDLTAGEKTLDSWICLTGYDGHFVKVRYTTQESTRESTEPRDFVDALAKHLWPND